MKRRARSTSAGKKTRSKTVTVPISAAVAEILERTPEIFGSGAKKKARDAFLVLALHEGLLAMSEYFDSIQESRRIWRSDLVFRFSVTPGVVGRAAQVEQEARAIDAVLDAAMRASEE